MFVQKLGSEKDDQAFRDTFGCSDLESVCNDKAKWKLIIGRVGTCK